MNDQGMARPAFVLLIATLLGGGFNTLFQIFMSNLIHDDVAELLTLLSILYIVAVPATAVQNVLIRYVSIYSSQGREPVIVWLMKRTMVLMTVAGLVVGIIVLLVLNVGEVRTTLKLTSNFAVLMLAIGVFISLVSTVGLGTLQGFQRFTVFGMQGVINYLIKFVLGVALVLLGFGLNGAMGGVVVGLAIGSAISFFFVRKHLFGKGEPGESKEIWWFTVPVMIGILCYTVLTQVDVIFASALMDKAQANSYASASIYAKIILYLPGAVSSVMFPRISRAHAEKEATVPLLRSSFLMVLALTGLATAIYVLFPNLILNILLPTNADRAIIAPTLQMLGVAMMLLGLTNLFMLYGLATDNRAYIYIMAVSLLVLAALVGGMVAGGIAVTPLILAAIMTGVGAFVLAVSWFYLFAVEIRGWGIGRGRSSP
jgi:O-antigen/teichoic acid export membrane protein